MQLFSFQGWHIGGNTAPGAKGERNCSLDEHWDIRHPHWENVRPKFLSVDTKHERQILSMAIQMSIKVRVLGECWQGYFPVQALHHSLAFRYLVYLQLRIRGT